MRNCRRTFIFGLAVIGCLGSSGQIAWSQLPTTDLRLIWPAGGTRGETVEIAVAKGENLDEIDSLWFSHPGIQATLLNSEPLPLEETPQPRWGQFAVAIASDVPEGLYDVRAIGRFGVSNPRRFAVSGLPIRVAGEERSTVEGAVPIDVSHAVQAHCSPRQTDHYRLTLRAGQRVRIDCRASEIDSQLSASLILRDPSGRELRHRRGSAESDPHLVWQADTAGEYAIEVYDFLFRGGPEFFYQLQVTLLDGDDQLQAEQPRSRIGISYLFGTRSAPASLPMTDAVAARVQQILGNAWSELPHLHATADEVQPIGVPALISGAFADRSGPATFEFAAAAGEELAVDVWSATVGAATDPQLLVERVHPQEEGDPRTERMVEVDDVQWYEGTLLHRHGRDPHVRFTAPESGKYRVVLRDLQESSEPEWDKRFWLSVRPPAPDFHVIAWQPHPSSDPVRSQPTGTCLRRGERIAIDVAVLARDGFLEDLKGRHDILPGLSAPYEAPWQWPIEVRVEGLPEGVSCTPLRLNALQPHGTLLLHAGESAARWTGPIRVVSRIAIPPQTLEREARYATMVWPDPRGQGAPSMRPSDALLLHVSDNESAPLQVQLAGEPAEWTGKRGAPLEVPLRIVRGDSCKGKVTLRAVGLPADVRAEEVSLEGDAVEAKLVLQIGGNAPLGSFSFHVLAETQLPWPRNPEALARAEARLVDLETQVQEPLPTTDASPDAEALQQAIMQVRERIEQLRESTKPRDTPLFAPSQPGQLRIELP